MTDAILRMMAAIVRILELIHNIVVRTRCQEDMLFAA